MSSHGKNSSISTIDEALSELQTCEGVRRLRFLAGQVLIHAGHRAPGIFVFLSGRVRAGAKIVRDSGDARPAVIPDLSAVGDPVPESVVIDIDAAAVFVPRSVVLREIAVRRLLQVIEVASSDTHPDER